MIGVAPPSIGAEPGGGFDATVAIPSQAPQIPGAQAPGAQAPGAVPAGLPRTEVMPAVAPGDAINPLGGTMLGGPTPDFSAAGGGLDKTALGRPSPLDAAPPQAAEAGPGGGTYGLGALAATSPAGDGPSPVAAIAGAQPAAPSQELVPGYAQPLAATGPVGKVRNPVAALLLGMLCFVYAIIAMIQMLGELKRFRQKSDLSLILFFIPIINIIEVLKLPEKVADAQRMAGVQTPQVAHPVLYLFFGLYFLPADLNEVWEAARRSAR